MDEEWRPITGFEGIYSISNQGRVRSEARTVSTGRKPGGTRRIRERILKNNPSGRGQKHQVVSLQFEDRKRQAKVHILVLEEFVSPRPEGMQGLHWDDDGHNNRLENLRWGTASDNMNDRVRNGIHPMMLKTECKWGHPFTQETTYINVRGGRECRTCMRGRKNRD